MTRTQYHFRFLKISRLSILLTVWVLGFGLRLEKTTELEQIDKSRTPLPLYENPNVELPHVVIYFIEILLYEIN
ncbi:hypothetical protein BpHYR1_015235 [Brachionus plicatilis]|uniref:Uncharacterized protein n=1 Tax=Brachionus plicatilis TaxID=10195 RepID=A0A3M7PH86_BRAPC|nr:hypothetical protein BpHYR1_015235 [Brachionus plicatilis]